MNRKGSGSWNLKSGVPEFIHSHGAYIYIEPALKISSIRKSIKKKKIYLSLWLPQYGSRKQHN